MERPHEGLLRADPSGYSLRAEEGTEMPVMVGRFADPGEWTEIRSVFEGHFMERFAPDAFVKTIKESAKRMKVLYHHGLDPAIGTKPLGPIRSLETDTAYEVDLLDADYVHGLLPALRAGLFGSSFKFDIVKEDYKPKPGKSDYNPGGIAETTITEARVHEFGPTPLPAYAGASAGVRSVTDEFLLAHLHADPDRLQTLVSVIRAAALQEAREPGEPTPPVTSEPPHSSGGATDIGEEAKPTWFLE